MVDPTIAFSGAIGSASIIIPSGGTIKILEIPDITGATDPLSMHDIATGADYQIPAGKQFWIFCCRGTKNSMSSPSIWSAPLADDNTGATKITTLYSTTLNQTDNWGCVKIPDSGNYINVTITGSGGGTAAKAIVWGVEF